ncbi:MAG: ATP-binding cassette domain-containing protein [Fibrobacteres bacterium]|nr:ATP-binding cassette domain-containing protein [Fibrobacterota bacterium]
MIEVSGLNKTFQVPVRESGLAAAVKSLIHRKVSEVPAVSDVSFTIEPGEIVGFIGPNGAGKTTTLKMLSGLIHPTSGSVQVLGHVPQKREPELLKKITLVMGQRNQLVWDIPVADTFELNRAVYRIPQENYKRTFNELVELLDLSPLLKKAARNLSLGERMKCEIAAALLHLPTVLFLDEPTIGLDVTMQRRIREFIREYNVRYNASVILTSHYMSDVEALCKRILLIHQGKLLFDGALADLTNRFSTKRTLTFRFAGACPDLSKYGEAVQEDNGAVKLTAAREDVGRTVAAILADCEVADLTVEEPPLEDVIHRVFVKGIV